MANTLPPILRGYARLVFGDGVAEGLLLAAATFERPASGLLGLLGVVVAQALAKRLGYASQTIASGYYAYNALLVGLSLSEAQPFGARLALLVAGGAVLATLCTAVFGDWLGRTGLPVLALPFVLVTTLVGHTTLGPTAEPFWLAPPPVVPHPAGLATLLQALGAIVFRPTPLGGALVLAAVTLRSRITAAALCAGAAVGELVAQVLGTADVKFVIPASYNGALTFAALAGAFFVPSRAAFWTATLAAALAAWLSLAFMLPFAPLAIPVLAWPFTLVTLCALRALNVRTPGRAPVPALLPGAAPEANLAYVRTFAKRLKLPGPPRFVLPVRGAWQITQGVHGRHTHRGPWAHALDFELVDREGFPFRGHGTALDDYYAFGQVVVAPGSGVIAAVYDSAPDNLPGAQDLARPWGNAVVIQHGPSLFSVVAHLERGSICVVVGQSVAAGEPLARCGSSGRSPRPHVHFQVQASPTLGAPALEFYLVDYVVLGKLPRFHRLGVPDEGDVVQTAEADALFGADSHALACAELGRVTEGRARVALRREISLFGEHMLVDAARGERLYFVPHAAGVVFTTLEGASDGALGALFQVAPFLPTVSLPALSFEEEIAPEQLLPLPLRALYPLLAIFVEPASARVRAELVRTQSSLVVESECSVRFLGKTVRRRRGRLEADAEGLASLELWPARFGARPLFKAERLAPGRAEPKVANRQDYGAPPCVV